MRKPDSVPPLFDWNYEPAMTSAGSQGSSDTILSQELSFPWQQALANIPASREVMEEPDRSLRFPFPNVMNSPATADINSPSWTSQPSLMLSNELNVLQSGINPLTQPSSPAKVPSSEATTRNCTCSTTAFEVLRTLYDRSTCTQIPFDTILATNKDALARISTILTCTCPGEPTLILTLAASITKMMSWYQSICRMPASQISSSQSPHQPPTATPIIVGVYRLDGEGETFVKIQVVLTELKKVDLLMESLRDRFVKQASTMPATAGQMEQEKTFFGDMIAFLRKKLREIVAGLQRDLKMDFGDVV